MSKWKALSSIPTVHLSLPQILMKAEAIEDTLTYESERQGIAYIANCDEFLIISSGKGFLRLNYNDLKTVQSEINGILEEVDRKRW